MVLDAKNRRSIVPFPAEFWFSTHGLVVRDTGMIKFKRILPWGPESLEVSHNGHPLRLEAIVVHAESACKIAASPTDFQLHHFLELQAT
jgi:hypothetical protein